MVSSAAESENQGGDAKTKQIDASDPTRIVTFLGVGPKITNFVDGSQINEVRVAATVGLGAKDMLTGEIGYGHHTGDKKSGMTNAQFRHFHLFKMDNSIEQGYRGWGSSVLLNLAGDLRGMDGQNSLGLGASPAFALGNDWQLYPIAMVLNSWDKEFSHYNGGGLNLSPMITKKIDWWDGGFIAIWPKYNRFLWGGLSGAGGGEIQMTVSGKFTPSLIWRLQGFHMFDKDFRGFDHKNGFDSTAKNSLFFRVESYF